MRYQAEGDARSARPHAAAARPGPRHQPELHPGDRGGRAAGPDLQERLARYFACRFEDIFDVVLVDPETRRERLLGPAEKR